MDDPSCKGSALAHVSHITKSGNCEATIDHLREVSDMAAEFARPFRAEGWASLVGLVHDIGKYSREFDQRIRSNGRRVDHSTAGAYELYRRGLTLLAYCAAGHHGGLPNGRSSDACDETTLLARMRRAHEGRIPAYDDYASEVSIELPSAPDLAPISSSRSDQAFSLSFLARMVFSCLVDADYLCTERFMQEAARDPLTTDSLETLLDRLERKLASFEPPTSDLNRTRCSIFDACRKKAVGEPGVYTLTVPTGGGKTYASLLFALKHALAEGNDMRRVIYGVPYTSIIEQNAAVFREVLGSMNVLEHHASFDFDDGEDRGRALRLAAENWDAPVVVTTNVRFFESLYSHKTSRCRRLHNVAGSVIVLDEAQMLPTKQLLPCLRVLVELVANYRCSVVLCTATQPSLGDLLARYGCETTEIAPDPLLLSERLRRVTFAHDGEVSDERMAERLAEQRQALCIVNSRKQALNLYGLLSDEATSYHLTTLMHPAHRERTLQEIRLRLRRGEACRVVATSLVEAGVDLDFPVVYRAVAGVDSMVQAAGRCNREGRRSAEESVVHLFDSEEGYALPNDVSQKAAIARSVMVSLAGKVDVEGESAGSCDIGSLEAIHAYFDQLYKQREDNLDANRVLEDLSGFTSLEDIPFKDASERFRMIEEGSHSIIVPGSDDADDVRALRSGEADRSTMRRLSRYTVGVYDTDLKNLLGCGAIEAVDGDAYVLLDDRRYDERTGLDVRTTAGEGLFW